MRSKFRPNTKLVRLQICFLTPKFNVLFFINRAVDCGFLADMAGQFITDPEDPMEPKITRSEVARRCRVVNWVYEAKWA